MKTKIKSLVLVVALATFCAQPLIAQVTKTKPFEKGTIERKEVVSTRAIDNSEVTKAVDAETPTVDCPKHQHQHKHGEKCKPENCKGHQHKHGKKCKGHQHKQEQKPHHNCPRSQPTQ